MSTVSMLPDWLTVREAAEEILGVTPQRVHQLVKTYAIRTKKPSPRLVLLAKADVVRVARTERPSGLHADRSGKAPRKRTKRRAG